MPTPFDQMDDLLQRICEKLQISSTQREQAEKRYEAVGQLLAKDEILSPVKPNIYPQGSLRIGTTVKPLSGQEYDLDLVCELSLVDYQRYDPTTILNVIETRLKANEIYRPLIERLSRCIRLNYANEFHLDILPACPDFMKNNGAVKVPDRELREWKDSNPKGYAEWFEQRSIIYEEVVAKVVEPLPYHEPIESKPPLKRAVQLIKRYRDIFFQKNGDIAPISIILTTLACSYYRGESSVNQTISNILQNIASEISMTSNRLVVLNPTNLDEDFSEKWEGNKELYESFVKWISNFQETWKIFNANKGFKAIEVIQKMFGEEITNIALKDQTEFMEKNRRNGLLGVSPSTGSILIGSSGNVLPINKNTFHGN